MEVKKHYDTHLANFYAWMVGDLEPQIKAFQRFLEQHDIRPKHTQHAIDLGAGNGIQSIALHKQGFIVTAVDFNQQLLDELNTHPEAKGIQTLELDITNVSELASLSPELIACCGDTLTHLSNKHEIATFITDAANILSHEGLLILTFRDYSKELNDQQRFIPVKSSPNRILTCILEYHPEKVKVTDLLYENVNTQWIQKVSSYEKVRISPQEIEQYLEQSGMEILFSAPINRMQTVIAKKIAE